MLLEPTVSLANDVSIPRIGYGTWPIDDQDVEEAVVRAIEAGYRLIDTAENYRNEAGVGRGMRASGLDRGELFVTTKFNGRWHGYEEAQEAFANSAELLGVEYIDLLLIHWPLPEQDRYVDAWRGMIKLLEDGKVRSIGVSNFKPAHLDRLIEETGVAPHVNQIQLTPRIARAAERSYHESHGIVTESWGPIGRGGDLLDEDAITRVARALDRTPAQVVLRWHLQLGLVPIPKTGTPARMHENLDVFDFTLDDAQMQSLTALDRGTEGALDSDTFGH